MKKYKLDHKWTLCIGVFCFPNTGQAMIRYIIYNNALNRTLEIKKYVCGTTTNNEVYYISLVEGLKEEKTYSTNYISVYTKSQLICNQMEGIYQVQKENLKPIHKKARIPAAQFQSFNLKYHSKIQKMSNDLVFGEVSELGTGANIELLSMSPPPKLLVKNQYRCPFCKCFF